MKQFLLICSLIGGVASYSNAQKIFLSHPEKKSQRSISVNSYVLFEYEFVDFQQLSKWGMVTGKILDIKDGLFLLERGGQQTWYNIKQLWAIKRLSRGAYRRATESAGSYGPDAGGPPFTNPIGVLVTSLVWSATVATADLIQHSPNFRFSQSKGWEFSSQEFVIY
jgi:hypothetical protein